ncbi:DUF2742 domain-containing protein [Mycobacterium sp. ENV421]|uniref:DUF2742 domain-containing protein n=1 Tax=Mycobacterium sp. ENV421 TaxID=1213407 RepID=UPI0013048FA7|nr:DUF2742 domain-containing protein [Mycobacterium sp. ENV421]
MDSRQITWYDNVFLFLEPWLGDPVIPGTPAWAQLPDDHPDKWRAVLWACVWWCLDQDTHQDATAAASREISTAAAWSQIGRDRGSSYIPRRKDVA